MSEQPTSTGGSKSPPAPSAAAQTGSPSPKSLQSDAKPNLSKADIVFVPPKLSEILDLTKISAESAKDITEIWRLFHEGKYAVCAAITSQQYSKLSERALRYPRFLVPVLRDNTGVIEMFTTEWNSDNLLVTSLAEYKVRGARASPALIMRHYRELENTKELVLMRGQIDPSRLSVAEAGLIANQFQLQYLSDNFLNLVRIFNETPDKFNVNDLLGVYLGRGKLTTPPPATSSTTSTTTNSSSNNNPPSQQQQQSPQQNKTTSQKKSANPNSK